MLERFLERIWGAMRLFLGGLAVMLVVFAAVFTMRSVRFHMPQHRRMQGMWTYKANYFISLLKIVAGSLIVGAALGFAGFFVHYCWTYYDFGYPEPGSYPLREADSALWFPRFLWVSVSYVFLTQLFKWWLSLHFLRSFSRAMPDQFVPATDRDARILGYADMQAFDTYLISKDYTDDGVLSRCDTWFARDILYEGVATLDSDNRLSTEDIARRADRGDYTAMDKLCEMRSIFGCPVDRERFKQALKERNKLWINMNGLLAVPNMFVTSMHKWYDDIIMPLAAGDLSAIMGHRRTSNRFPSFEFETSVVGFLLKRP